MHCGVYPHSGSGIGAVAWCTRPLPRPVWLHTGSCPPPPPRFSGHKYRCFEAVVVACQPALQSGGLRADPTPTPWPWIYATVRVALDAAGVWGGVGGHIDIDRSL